MNPFHCPYCHRALPHHTKGARSPRPKDYGVCVYCHSPAVFDRAGGELILRKLTSLELLRLPDSLKKQLVHTKNAIESAKKNVTPEQQRRAVQIRSERTADLIVRYCTSAKDNLPTFWTRTIVPFSALLEYGETEQQFGQYVRAFQVIINQALPENWYIDTMHDHSLVIKRRV